ncbi:MAG: SoxR reducing system RseC family protein [Ignavibacteria bacterium]|nr:SoxR reducing system RseC family protein [Ignavibacteria bacterium]
MSEQITERGIVTNKKNNILEVVLSESGNCNECSAKIFCKPGNTGKKIILVKDTIGCNVGDCIDFSIPGSNLLKLSVKFYGLPLIILVLSVIICNYYLSDNILKELYSILISIFIVLIYFLVLFFVLKQHGKPAENIPVTVHRY